MQPSLQFFSVIFYNLEKGLSVTDFFVSDICIYQPPLENPAELPKLEFCDPLFKRRLSQISRMTIQVVHDLIQKIPDAKNAKLVFSSFRGELARELKINKSLYEDADVMPASFSISVFNTPPAAATIVEKIKSGYTAVFPSNDNFYDALAAAAAPVLCGDEQKILFVYADELIIEEYKAAYKNPYGRGEPFPLAFACLLSAEQIPAQTNDRKLNLNALKDIKTPQEFLRSLNYEIQD